MGREHVREVTVEKLKSTVPRALHGVTRLRFFAAALAATFHLHLQEAPPEAAQGVCWQVRAAQMYCESRRRRCPSSSSKVGAPPSGVRPRGGLHSSLPPPPCRSPHRPAQCRTYGWQLEAAVKAMLMAG